MAGIVACAWTLAREHGIAGVSLHALAREVGIRQPSLYEYFDSKNALYDAMFADGNRRLIQRLDAVTFSREPRDALKQWLAAFTTFAGEDPARYQLLFQRPAGRPFAVEAGESPGPARAHRGSAGQRSWRQPLVPPSRPSGRPAGRRRHGKGRNA